MQHELSHDSVTEALKYTNYLSCLWLYMPPWNSGFGLLFLHNHDAKLSCALTIGDTFLFEQCQTIGALFILLPNWKLNGVRWMCVCACFLFFSVFFPASLLVDQSALRAPIDYWKLRGLEMLGGHFGVLIQLLMADRNSTSSDPENKCVFVCICGWSSVWEWPERVTLLFCSACLGKWSEDEYISQSICTGRDAEASALNGWDRLDCLIPFY